ARILNVVLFTIFIFGVGFMLYIIMRRAILSIIVSLFMLSAPVMVYNFTGVMSEPLFFCLGFFGLFLALVYVRKKQKVFLWMSAVLTGLAFVSRFTGVTMIAAGSATILLFSDKSIKNRFWEALSYITLGLIPFVIWTIYLRSMGGYPGQYTIPAYPEMVILLRSSFRALTETVVGWTPWGSQLGAGFPRHHAMFLLALGVGGLLILLLTLFKQGKISFRSAWGKPNFQIGLVFGVFNLVYCIFLLLTYLFVEHPKPVLDVRMLSPLLVGGMLSIVGFLDFILEDQLPFTLRQLIPVGVILLFIVSNINPTKNFIQIMHLDGDGYTSKAWQESGVIKAVKGLPANAHIISDNIDVIMLYTFRSASRIPELESKTPQPLGQPFGDDLNDSVQTLFRNGKAVLVLFNQAYWQFDAIYGGQATQTRFKAFTNGLSPYYIGGDGSIYYYAVLK
ncbi:MAG TPA: hypothetical protein VF326_03690, partial [Anaerolineaceae bacterium]